ncbi:MAG: helix-hairpin-helix domain-containing protein [Lachnospiraceae bacterium]|nr:helix-hairpin-helix domain-containing protein [Lachnospiraceae bacterium]
MKKINIILFTSFVFVMVMLLFNGCKSKSYLQHKEKAVTEENSKEQDSKEQDFKGQDSKNQDSTGENISQGKISYVQLSGAVNKPGVYDCNEGTRLFQLIEKSGGFKENAYQDNLNLASEVVDGQKIHIYTVDEANYLIQVYGSLGSGADTPTSGASDGAVTTGSGTLGGSTSTGTGTSNSGLVNINTDSVEELTSLTGIGETRAKAIIQYRKEHGNFTSKEQLKEVSGIGESTFGKIENSICVK